MSHPSNISGLDSTRTTLIKRAFIEQRGKTDEEVDALLVENYGPEWKKVFGIEEAEIQKCSPVGPYLGKSLRELDEEFFEKEKKKA